ncbi:2,3-diketo-5-methylthio-1-phosphopentane phosphatase [Choiromyces venosus 120613-1]|uniref:2,3-diketo-5-methylthio-1-phosphopentane phosphatase n=1 Tax=Choiromyces venosus 120613-1 TaxID=1336337 RepID=A0A3N4JR56_9PEZI|nr:2,3-diketo-5-methylthio-1-phosphopentane phosphatase [Choiromyces venosus 120613-1]
MPPKTILIDIEGVPPSHSPPFRTICPVTFVQTTLYPYALHALPAYLTQHWTTPLSNPLLTAFPPEHTTSPEALTWHIQALTAQNSKSPALKALQGHLWQSGYESGDITAPIYPDVLPAIRSWKEKGVKVYVYSSGSVKAQELFFRYSSEGDIRGVFDGFFDTKVGAKVEAGSYRRILRECGGGENGGGGDGWVFLSDHVGEVKAAKEAGMMGGVVVREGNAPLSEEDKEGMWVIEGGFAEVTEKLFAE